VFRKEGWLVCNGVVGGLSTIILLSFLLILSGDLEQEFILRVSQSGLSLMPKIGIWR